MVSSSTEVYIHVHMYVHINMYVYVCMNTIKNNNPNDLFLITLIEKNLLFVLKSFKFKLFIAEITPIQELLYLVRVVSPV